MSRYSLSEETLNKALGYLGSRPYVETATIVDAIRNDAKLVEGSQENLELSPSSEQQPSEQAVS